MSILIWGHRGHRHHRFAKYYGEGIAYENSLRAYQETLATCMGLECDVIQSKEATIYLAHDTMFEGIVHYELKLHLNEASKEKIGGKYIYQLSNEEVRSLALKNGEAIPALRSLLEKMPLYPGRILNLELKGPNTVDPVLRSVERAIQNKLLSPQQVVFSSFNLPALRDLRSKAGPRFKIGALFALKQQPISPMFPNWPNAPQDASYIPFKLEDGVLDRDDLRDIAPDYFNIEYTSFDREVIDAIAEKYPKSKIILWTAGEKHPSESMALIDIVKTYVPTKKIYAVITDFPREVQKILLEQEMDVRTP